MILPTLPAQIRVDWILLWMKMGWLDIVFLIVFVLGIVLGLKNGLAKVLPRFIEVVIAQIVTVEYSKALAEFMQIRFRIPLEIIHIVVFAVLAVGVIFLIRFLFQLLAFVASVDFKPPIDNSVGAILSGLRLILLLGLVASFLTLFPLPFIQETFTSRSLSGPYLVASSRKVHDFFVGWLPHTWRAT